MKKSVAMSCLALAAALAFAEPLMAQDGVYSVNARSADRKDVTISVLISQSSKSRAAVQEALNLEFRKVMGGFSSDVITETSMIYANQAQEPLTREVNAALAKVSKNLDVTAHSARLRVNF